VEDGSGWGSVEEGATTSGAELTTEEVCGAADIGRELIANEVVVASCMDEGEG